LTSRCDATRSGGNRNAVRKASLSSPIPAYLEVHAGQLEQVTFFCTMSRFGCGRVFRQMEDASVRDRQHGQAESALATFAATERRLWLTEFPGEVDAYIERLQVRDSSFDDYGGHRVDNSATRERIPSP
jgi:hypothetical protein